MDPEICKMTSAMLVGCKVSILFDITIVTYHVNSADIVLNMLIFK